MKRQAPHPSRAAGSRGLRADAARLLAVRPRSFSELSQALVRRGHDAEEAARLCELLCDEGTLNDLELSLHYILARSERLGHGRRRLLRELEERGVDREVAREAWRSAVEAHGLDPRRLLERRAAERVRAGGGRRDGRSFRRVYNALLRAGFDAAEVRSALESLGEWDLAGAMEDHDLP